MQKKIVRAPLQIKWILDNETEVKNNKIDLVAG
jgi:hypothetical protein